MTENKFQRFSNRFFQVSSLFTREGWYIKLRDGVTDGPYSSEEQAKKILSELIGNSTSATNLSLSRARQDNEPTYYSKNTRG